VRRVAIADGTDTAVERGEVLLCTSPLLEIAYLSERRNAGYLQKPCTPDGRGARGKPSVEAVREAGLPAGTVTLVATRQGITAYDVKATTP
jgi:hypothetical protein